MKIMHILPGDNFTLGMGYQDNFLAKINSLDGNNVMILTSCATWVDSSIKFVSEEDTILDDGVRLVRQNYQHIINKYITRKLRILKNTSKILNDFKPDVIRMLNPHNLTLTIVSRYVKINPNVKFYIDSHQQDFNSGTNFISKFFFHRVLIRFQLYFYRNQITKIFFCEEGVRNYLLKNYKINQKLLELYPLGGLIISPEEISLKSRKIRNIYSINETDTVLVHSGKFSEQKLTSHIIEAFKKVKGNNLRLLLVGSIPFEMEKTLYPLIQSDERIQFLGWRSSNDLFDIICSADLYLQPGSSSVTCIQAMCSV